MTVLQLTWISVFINSSLLTMFMYALFDQGTHDFNLSRDIIGSKINEFRHNSPSETVFDKHFN